MQTQQTEEKPQSSTEAAPDQTPAEFWSRLKNNQAKPATGGTKELNQATAATDNRQPCVATSPTNHQPNSAKAEEKDQESKKEKPPTKELKAPVSQNIEAVNKVGEAAKKMEVKAPETSSNPVVSESGKMEQSEAVKPTLPPEKDVVKDKVDLSKGTLLNETKQPVTGSSSELKATVQKPTTEEVAFVDVAEVRTAWPKDTLERKEPKAQDKSPQNNTKELEAAEVKKTEKPPAVKQGMRGVIRMANPNNKPQQASEAEDQVETKKDDVKLLKKDDTTPNLKPALVGESSASSSPEKKTVTFAEPLNEDGEIKVLLNTTKDLGAKDGKREILAPSTLGEYSNSNKYKTDCKWFEPRSRVILYV